MYESQSAVSSDKSLSESPFSFRLQIESFRLRVSSSLARPLPKDGGDILMRERSTMYRLLNSDLDELERQSSGSCGECEIVSS